MDGIRSAIQRIENSATVKRAHKLDQDVQDALSQLSSAATLLELSTLPHSTLTRLTELLRGRLLPLYRISSILTLDYALSIFRFIHQNKFIGNKQAETTRPWESVLESLFSGILDFLEDKSTGKLRDNIASTLYPVLCPVFFVGPQERHQEFDGNLLSTVYQLLLMTVDSNAKNASKLRDTNIGSVNFGFTIYRTKDFLAMESLLDLFALLIPPLKAGREKRTQFIKEVFNPSLFSCSDQIIHCLESICNPDWSITSAKIMKTLADSDISFPQPLVVAAFALNGEEMNVSTFFVDRSKFVASIDMDGKIETLHVPFSIIRKISGSPSSSDVARIVAVMTQPPVMGDTHIETHVEGDQTISWNIERKLLERFRQAVISRGLTIELSARTKQSKAEEISLDFQAEKQTPSTWKKNKVESLSQLWNAGVPTNEDQEAITSPLAPVTELKSISKVGIAGLDRPDILEKDENSTVFVHPDGNLSFEPKEYIGNPTKTDIPDKKPVLQADDPFEDDNVLPSRSKFFSNKRILSLSDDEIEGDPSGAKTIADDVKRLSPVKNDEPHRKRPKESKKSSVRVELADNVKKTAQSKKNTTNAHNPEEAPHGEPKVADNTKKRKSEAVFEQVSVDRKTSSPSKRPRLGSPNHPPLSPARVLPKNRYGRGGRALLSDLAEVDFDEVPGSTRTSEPRASRMKDKTGKALPKPKSGLTKKVVEKKKRPDAKKQVQKSVESDADITLVEIKDKKIAPEIAVPTKEEKHAISRSIYAGGSIVDNNSNPKPKKVVDNNKGSKQSRKAPWARDDFSKHAQEMLSGDIVDGESESKGSNEDEKKSNLVERSSDDIITEVDENLGSKETIIDSLVSLPFQSASKVITIDLTHDDVSPSSVKHTPKISVVASPHEKSIRAYTQQRKQPIEECSEVDDSPIRSPDAHETYPKIMRGVSPQEFRSRHRKVPAIETKNTTSIGTDIRRENKRQPALNFDLPDDEDRLHIRDMGGKNSKKISMDHRRRKEPYSHSTLFTHPPRPKQYQQASTSDLPDPMEKISSILGKINEAVIQNVARRFDAVTDKLNEGQRTIIAETIPALEEMLSISESHLESLMDLETQYRAACAKIVQGAHDHHKAAEQVNQAFKKVLSERAAQSLCKKFPTKLVPKIPALFLDVQARRS